MDLQQALGISIIIVDCLRTHHLHTEKPRPCSRQSRRNGRSVTPAMGPSIYRFSSSTFPIFKCFIALIYPSPSSSHRSASARSASAADRQINALRLFGDDLPRPPVAITYASVYPDSSFIFLTIYSVWPIAPNTRPPCIPETVSRARLNPASGSGLQAA